MIILFNYIELKNIGKKINITYNGSNMKVGFVVTFNLLKMLIANFHIAC